MVCTRVQGNHAQIAFAGSMGQFELNVFKPCMIASLLQSIRLLGDACTSFALHCVKDLEINRKQIDAHVSSSLMLVTALNTHIGYDNAAKIAKYAHKHGLTLREAAVTQLKLLTDEQFNTWVRAEDMIKPFPLKSKL